MGRRRGWRGWRGWESGVGWVDGRCDKEVGGFAATSAPQMTKQVARNSAYGASGGRMLGGNFPTPEEVSQ